MVPGMTTAQVLLVLSAPGMTVGVTDAAEAPPAPNTRAINTSEAANIIGKVVLNMFLLIVISSSRYEIPVDIVD
jgi:hypothetical protein